MTWAHRLALLLSLGLVPAGCGDDAGGRGSGGDGDADGSGSPGDGACDSDVDCDDGDYCNGTESCDDGVCVAGEVVDCDDGIDCTFDRCDDERGTCVNRPPDADDDGHGDAECVDGDGEPLGDDCDDGDENRFPGNPEVCDESGHDEDCDVSTLGGRYEDEDDDGFVDDFCCNTQDDGALLCGTDCNDRQVGVNPGTPEACNEIDDDCDGAIDEDVEVLWFADEDGDGFGDPTDELAVGCGTRPVGRVLDNTDCDDRDNQVSPGAREECDGRDTDCDGKLDGPGEDRDLDGVVNAECCADGLRCVCDETLICDCDDDMPEVGAGPRSVTIDAIDTAGDLLAVAGVTCVAGNFTIKNVVGPFDAPLDIEWVGRRLQVMDTSGFSDLTMLQNVTHADTVTIDGSQHLTSLAGLEGITSLPDGFRVFGNPVLENVEALSGLTSAGFFAATSNPALSSLRGLEGITELPGEGLYVIDCGSLADLTGLDNLQSAAGVEITDHGGLQSLDGLAQLRTVSGDLHVGNNAVLSSIDALHGVQSIAGSLWIWNHPLLPQCKVDEWLAGGVTYPTASISSNGGDNAACQ